MTTNPQPGWYPDPSGNPTRLRYWDGAQWLDQYTDLQVAAPAAQAAPSATAAAPYQPVGEDRTLRLVAFIFAVISTVSVCWLIIPLAWMIPMTVHCWSIYKGTSGNSVAFGVCTLIFLSLVGGILLLVSKKDK